MIPLSTPPFALSERSESKGTGRRVARLFFAACVLASAPARAGDAVDIHQTAFDVGGSWVWKEHYEIGAVLPVTINQTAGNANDLDPRVPGSVPAQGVGDFRLVPKEAVAAGRKRDRCCRADRPVAARQEPRSSAGRSRRSARARSRSRVKPACRTAERRSGRWSCSPDCAGSRRAEPR